ncbi:MAG TPA: ribonuclease E inhibitor RraB, partial [Thermoleophilia bacterium]|nr:ribonuclease E inhibitor RraB [Thermoleophilia bacterium]
MELVPNRPRRFWSEAAYALGVADQLDDVQRVLQKLHESGVESDDQRRLEFFFYTDTEPKAAGLAAALGKMSYEVRPHPSPHSEGLQTVTGWTTP